MTSNRVDPSRIQLVAGQIVEFLETTESSARSEIELAKNPRPGAILDVNSANRQRVADGLTKISDEKMRELARIVEEPAIARIVATDEHEITKILFICRATPPDIKIPGVLAVSYRAPMGRLGSFNVGDGGGDISLPRGKVYWELTEKASFSPVKTVHGWDSTRTVFQFEGMAPSTAASLVALLPGRIRSVDNDDPLGRIFESERKDGEIIECITRTVIERIELRDQPLLDKFQDEIFRLALSTQLVLLGPAGTGKTTTLIRRLGQKLDWEHLDENERRSVEKSAVGHDRHRSSWLMFTPTDLLKAYLKEAFAIEEIPASDERITTWADYRVDLARNRLKILRTPHAGGVSY